MAITFFEGFEHGIVSAAGTGLWNTVTGASSSDIQTSVTKHGLRALRLNTSASAKMVTRTISQTVVAAGFHVLRPNVTPGSSRPIVRVDINDTNLAYVRLNTSNQLDLATWNGTTETVLGNSGTLTVDQWYWVDLLVDASTNPWTLSWQVDGVAQTGGTLAVAGATLNNFRLGDAVNTTRDFYLDNVVVANSGYPLGEQKILGYSPTGVGTHNLDAATSQFFFKDIGGTETALTTSETTSYQQIDDVPLDADSDHVLVKASRSGADATPALSGTVGAIAATAGNVATPTTLQPALPSGYASGSVILCLTSCRSATPTVATPSGWTSLLNTTGTNGRIALFAKVADGTEAVPDVTWSSLTTGNSGTPAQAQCAAFDNLDQTLASVVDVTGTVENGAASSTVSAGGANVTTNDAKSLVLSLTTRLDDAGTISAGAGFTIVGQGGTTSGADKAQAWQYQVKDPAGSVTVPDFSIASGSSFASSGIAIALKAGPALTQPTNTWYLEYAVADSGESTAPAAVRGVVAVRNDSGTTANSITARLRDGSSDGDIFSGDIGSATTVYKSALFTSKPSGGAWTDTAFDALTLRWGFTGDADSTPRLESAMVVALFAVGGGTTTPQGVTATVTTTATVATSRLLPRTIQATVTTTANVAKQAGKAVTATATSTATVVKRAGKTVAATVTSTASQVAQKVILKTVEATVTTTATLARRINKPVAATVTTTAAVTRRAAKTVQATVTSTASLSALKVFIRALTATVTSSATMTRRVGKPVTATVTTTAAVSKRVAKLVTATATTTGTLLAQRVFLRTVTATVTTTASLSRSTGKVVEATVTTAGSVAKRIAATVTALVSSTATIVATPGSSQPIGHLEGHLDTTTVGDGLSAVTLVEGTDRVGVGEAATTMTGSID